MSDGGGTITIGYKTLSMREPEMVEMPAGSTVADLKRKLDGKHGIVAERSFALFSGRRLADDDVLDERFDALTTIMIITQALKPPDPRPAAVEMIRLNVRHGADTIMIDVSPSWTWQEVKERALAGRTTIPPRRMRLLFAGAKMKDEERVGDEDLADATCVHLVEERSSMDLSERVVEHMMRHNCSACHHAGAQLYIRVACPRCHDARDLYEHVLLGGDSSIDTDGSITWRDLARLTGECFQCGHSGGLRAIFICGAVTDGRNCVTRHPDRADRSRYVVKPGMPDDDLLELLNEIYGYAHAAGYET